MAFFRNFADISDTAGVLVTSANDKSLMIVQTKNNDYYMPFVRCSGAGPWTKLIAIELNEIFGDIEIKKLLRLTKVWYPKVSQIYTMHCIFHFEVSAEMKNKSKLTSGKFKGKIRWILDTEILKFLSSNILKSPEIYELYWLSRGQSPPLYTQQFPISLKNKILEITDEVFVSTKRNASEMMVSMANYNLAIQEMLYKEFLTASLPATLMGLTSFTKVMSTFGWPKDSCLSLFRSADISQRMGLSYREFLFFMAATDGSTNLTGSSAEIRNVYIFRYYDKDQDKILNNLEFKAYITDARQARKQSVDAANVAKEATETYKLLGLPDGQNINMASFLKLAKENKIKYLKQVVVCDYDMKSFLNKTPQPKTLETQIKATAANLPFLNNKSIKYDYCMHTVQIPVEKTSPVAVNLLFDIADTASAYSLKAPLWNPTTKKQSMDTFNTKSVMNEVMKAIRILVPKNMGMIENKNIQYIWGEASSGTFLTNLKTLCNNVAQIFKKEPRLQKVKAPVYIMGDLHGNITNLLSFEKTLWPLGPNLCPCNLLFLGDYVDRGFFGLELVAILFCYKAQSPDKVHLLRGNHEIRDVQRKFTFYNECIRKCGQGPGIDIWNAINNVFDHMPIAAVVDESIFCCHGGCPPPWICPSMGTIEDIPVPLIKPSEQSSLAWEIMWNDPVRAKNITEKLKMELTANDGFAINTKRGTAHMFSEEALDRFLKCNKLTHLIRSHEVLQFGYYMQQKGKLVGVFSSSGYGAGESEAGAVLVDCFKIRILRMQL